MKTLHYLIAGFRPALSIIRHWLALPLLCLGAGLPLVQPCAAAPFEWQTTGNLTTATVGHTATLLTDGKVLVAGGRQSNGFAVPRSEIYDPAIGTWAPSGELAEKRD